MRSTPDGSPLGESVLSPVTEITSWLGGRYLGTVPISQGHISEQASDPLATLEITVPETAPWVPVSPTHMLATAGQELVVRRGWRLASGETVGWVILGRFRLWSTTPDGGGWQTSRGESIDSRLDHARWVKSTRTSGTFSQQARRITAGVLPLIVDAPDRATAARTWEQGDTRRESLTELLDAWGASLRIMDGQAVVVPRATSSSPVLSVMDGPRGTVTDVGVKAEDTLPNAVVASTAPEDNEVPVSRMARLETGPYRWGGPYGQIPQFFASPLLTTPQDCLSAAYTRLERVRDREVDLDVSMVTDPRLELDDVIRVTTDRVDAVGRVVAVRHALTPGQEPGSVSLRVLSGTVQGVEW